MKCLNGILNSKTKKGFILLYAVLIMSMLLALTFSITDLTVKERKLSRFVEESFSAFFAAESGIECALYWDLRYEKSAFRYDDITEPGGRKITCNGDEFTVGTSDVTEITLTFPGSSNSSVIKVDKSVENNTSLTAEGYSVADPSSGDGIERGIQVKYGDKVDSGDKTCMFDILFVIDNSRSICLADKKTPQCVGESKNMQSLRDAAKKVVKNFKDDISEDGTKFSVIGFETTAFMQERLSATTTDINSAIDAMKAVGGTNTGGGFLLAEYELNSDNDREKAKNIIILMTDGDGNACIDGDIYKAGFGKYIGKYAVNGIDWCGVGKVEAKTKSENETRLIIDRLKPKSGNDTYLIVIAIEGADFDGKVAFNEAFMQEIADKYYLVEDFNDIKDVTKDFNCGEFSRLIDSIDRREF